MSITNTKFDVLNNTIEKLEQSEKKSKKTKTNKKKKKKRIVLIQKSR